MTAKKSCPKCQGNMLEGWTMDIGKGTRPTQWVEGRPESSLWTVTKTPRDKVFAIATYGCSSCGYLESYAQRNG
jgi:predicted nucleic-acid-binding Zn-ribbon protein